MGAHTAFARNAQVLFAVCVVLAVLYNPILRVHLFKEFWMVINLASAVLLIVTRKQLQQNA